MKKIYTLIILVAFSASVIAQQGSVTPEKIGSKEKVDVPVGISNKAPDDTLGLDEFFNAGQPIIFSAGAGHVNGTYWSSGSPGNSNGSAVGYFNFGRYAVEEILAWCGSKDYASGGGTSYIKARVHLMDDSTKYSGGSISFEGKAPGTQVGGSDSIMVANIDTSSAGANGFVAFQLSTPAEIGPNDGDWAVVLDWQESYAVSDTIGFVMSADNPTNVTYTFTDYNLQYYIPGAGPEWVRFQDAWQSWNDNIPAHWAVVDTKVGMPETFDGNGVKLYQNVPNPSAGNTRISYQVEESTHAYFQVINSVGKLVYSEDGMRNPNQTYNVDFNRGDLAPGVYYYSLVVNGNRLAMKMIISE